MALSSLRRTAAAVAVAATAAALVVPALSNGTASATGLAVTSLSIRTVHPSVKPGGTDRVTGDLAIRDGLSPAGRPVALEARAKGEDGFTPIAQATTGDRGGVHVSVTPAATTRYRWHYLGGPDARPSVSGVATIRVRTPQHAPNRLVTTLAVRVAHRVVRRDGGDVVRGRLSSHRVPIRHRWVILISRPPDATGWSFVAAHRTGPLGGVAFGVAPADNTAYRLAFLGTPLLQRARSAIVYVGVRPEVSISVSPDRIDRGQTTTISGSVTHAGVPLSGATVRLLARQVGTQHRFRLVTTSTTLADGSVSFVETPDRPTAYRLRVVHGVHTPNAISRIMRVWVRLSTSLSIRGLTGPAAYRVSGILRGEGHPLRNRLVTLMSQAPGSTTWSDAGTGTTGKHGVVQFSEPPSARHWLPSVLRRSAAVRTDRQRNRRQLIHALQL